MGTGCFNSNVLLETSPKKSIMASKFSQALDTTNSGGGFSEMLAVQGNSLNDNSPRKNKNSMDLHKQALMNAYKEKKEFDVVPDENCTVMSEWEKKKSGISKKTPQFDRGLD